MNGKVFSWLIIPALIILSACQAGNEPPQKAISMPNTPTTTFPTASRVSTARNGKEEIINEIKQISSQYNLFIDSEKKTGNLEITTSPDGSEEITFTNVSYMKVMTEYLRIQEKISALNEEYYNLYIQGIQATQTFDSPNQNNQYEKLLEEYSNWLPQELKTGSIVMIYSPVELKYTPVLIGDSYAHMKEKGDKITALRLSTVMPPAASIKMDIELIQSIESGSVTLMDIGVFPYYRADIKLTTYKTNLRFYNLYTDAHEIIEIIPKQIPSGNAKLSPSVLESLAKELISKISPKINLDNLTPVPNSKEGTYFFRWEDRTKPLLDDGRSYPFIQVGLNGNGELLNYINSLPLAR
jgi:hypothetical protein